MAGPLDRNAAQDPRTRRAFAKLRSGNLLADAVIFNEIPDGAIDGVNDVFKLSEVPEAGTLMLFVSGLLMREDDDFVLTGKTITMQPGAVPGPGEWMRATYRKE